MNEKKCRDFLKLLFFQCLVDESFFGLCKKLGVDPKRWPDDFLFNEARLFFKHESEGGWGFAILKCNIKETPLEAHHSTIGENEIKIFYNDYLRHLEAITLFKRISIDPSKAEKLCQEFLEQKQSTAEIKSIDILMQDFVADVEFKINNKIENTKLSMFPVLSDAIGGFNHSRIGIVTAETGFGKSQLAVNLMKNTIKDNYKLLYINMEMDTNDIMKRFVQSICNMNAYEFREKNYISKMSSMDSTNFNNAWITDGSSMSLSDIKKSISKIHRENKLDFVVIDYDQKILMEEYGIKEEWKYLQKAIEELEEIAKREKLHIILFSQSATDGDGRPIASKRSTQPASYVINFTEDDGKTIMKLIKNRHGANKIKIEYDYDRSKSRITEIGLLKEDKSILPPPIFKRGFKNPYVD